MKLIRTTNGQHVKVDDADFEMLSAFSWHALWDATTASFYAIRALHGETIGMHRLLMGATGPKQVDHRNHDTLDNQRDNLRVCTPSENQWNRRPNSGTRSGLKGAYWNKGAWVARIKINHKSTFLGRFASAEEAHEAYCSAASKRSSEFACTA